MAESFASVHSPIFVIIIL